VPVDGRPFFAAAGDRDPAPMLRGRDMRHYGSSGDGATCEPKKPSPPVARTFARQHAPLARATMLLPLTLNGYRTSGDSVPNARKMNSYEFPLPVMGGGEVELPAGTLTLCPAPQTPTRELYFRRASLFPALTTGEHDHRLLQKFGIEAGPIFSASFSTDNVEGGVILRA
jgi:hypothetical protein